MSNRALAPPLSEAASKKRGRPPVFSDRMLAFYGGEVCNFAGIQARSRRQQQNRGWAMRASHQLRGRARTCDPAFAWLMQDRPAVFRTSLLTELGRFQSPKQMRTVAGLVCRLRPTVKEGVRLVRAYRLGRLTALDALRLYGRE